MQSFSNKSSFPFRNAKRFIRSKSSFTLIELLIVIGILAILTAAVVIVLNPTELLKQGRDSKRSTDIASVHKSIQLLTTQASAISLGAASTVSVSLPDTSPTCANLSLPTLPSGYTYRCVPTASSTLINGSGWLPIDFTQSSIQNFSALPIDPTNTSSTGLYYTYMPTNIGTYELSTLMESEKGSQQAITDGGILPGVLETGSALAQTPPLRDRGLVGYWTFDEGSGTTAYDRSGYNNNGTLTNNPIWQTITNCKRGGCLLFDGVDDYIGIPYAASLAPVNQVSVMGWANRSGLGEWRIISKTETGGYDFNSDIYFYTFRNGTYSAPSGSSHTGWVFLTGTYDGRYTKLYIDGVLASTNDAGGNYPITYSCSNSLIIGAEAQCYTIPTAPYFNGLIDDVRIYNRALSAAEILSIYNSTK